MKKLVVIVCALAICLIFGNDAEAHSIFKKQLQKRYDFGRVSCWACHVKGEKKDKRNEFGKLFDKPYKGLNISKTYKELKEEDNDEKIEAYEEFLIKEFKKAMTKIEKQKKDGKTYLELLKTGKIPETFPKEDDDDE